MNCTKQPYELSKACTQQFYQGAMNQSEPAHSRSLSVPANYLEIVAIFPRYSDTRSEGNSSEEMDLGGSELDFEGLVFPLSQLRDQTETQSFSLEQSLTLRMKGHWGRPDRKTKGPIHNKEPHEDLMKNPIAWLSG